MPISYPENVGQSSSFKRAGGRYTTFTGRDSREAVLWKGHRTHRTKTKSELGPTKLAKNGRRLRKEVKESKLKGIFCCLKRGKNDSKRPFLL